MNSAQVVMHEDWCGACFYIVGVEAIDDEVDPGNALNGLACLKFGTASERQNGLISAKIVQALREFWEPTPMNGRYRTLLNTEHTLRIHFQQFSPKWFIVYFRRNIYCDIRLEPARMP